MDDYFDADEKQKVVRRQSQGMLRSLLSPLLDRATLASIFSTTFRGKRDYYEALGYSRVLTAKHFRARYDRGGIASTIVDTWPETTWGGEWGVKEDDDPNKVTAFEQAWIDLDKRLRIHEVFKQVDILAGLGRYAVIMIGAPGDTDQPLVRCRPDDIKFLQCYGEDEAPITRYDESTTSERFAFPVLYGIKRRWVTQLGVNPPATINPVHYTRILHVADNKLDDPIFGASRLEKVWNRLDDLDKVIGGGSESFYKRADGGTVFNVDKDLVIDPDPSKVEAKKLEMQDKFDAFTHELQKNLVVRGIEVNRLGSEVADLRGPAAAIMDQIAAITKIPQRVLMGSELGRLAAQQDKGSFDDRVEQRRKGYATYEVLRPFVDKMIALGALPAPAQYDPDWPSTDELSQTDRVTAAMNISAMNKNAGTIIVTPSEIRTVYLGLEAMTSDQLKEVDQIKAEKMANNPLMAGLPGGPPAPARANPPPAPVDAPRAAEELEEVTA